MYEIFVEGAAILCEIASFYEISMFHDNARLVYVDAQE